MKWSHKITSAILARFSNPLGGPRAGTEELLSGGWCGCFASLVLGEEFLKIRLKVATRFWDVFADSYSSLNKMTKCFNKALKVNRNFYQKQLTKFYHSLWLGCA